MLTRHAGTGLEIIGVENTNKDLDPENPRVETRLCRRIK